MTLDATLTVDSGPTADLPAVVDGPTNTYGIYITEIMANPDAVADADGEWFELYNGGPNPVDLQGWTISDADIDTHVIAVPLTVNPGQYVVLGINGNSQVNGGVSVAYTYPADPSALQWWYISNRTDEIFIADGSGNIVDRVEYSTAAGFLFPTEMPKGASLSRKSILVNANVASNWCVETAAWSGSAGDKGTPGGPAGCP